MGIDRCVNSLMGTKIHWGAAYVCFQAGSLGAALLPVSILLTSLGTFLPTDMPSFQPMPRSMASPKEAIGMASYAPRLASCVQRAGCAPSLQSIRRFAIQAVTASFCFSHAPPSVRSSRITQHCVCPSVQQSHAPTPACWMTWIWCLQHSKAIRDSSLPSWQCKPSCICTC